MKLRDVQAGQRGRVIALDRADTQYRAKLMRLGLRRGSEFTLLRCAPLGDPIELSLDGSLISLRKNEADALEVEVIS